MIRGTGRWGRVGRGASAVVVAMLVAVGGAALAVAASPGRTGAAGSGAASSGAATSLSSGGSHSCVVTTSGGVKCWGYNISGELGDGTTTSRSTAVDVVGLTSGVAMVSAGTENTCALTSAGGVKCWGDNGLGQLGAGNIGVAQSDTPVDVVGLSSGVIAVAVGFDHACAVTTGGTVKCWGYNAYGQLGNGTTGGTSSTPVRVVDLGAKARALALGDFHSCAITSVGVSCWGLNANGQLGSSTGTSSASPVAATKLGTGVKALSADGDRTCAVSSAGKAYCWGNNRGSYLGVGRTQVRVLAPAPVVGLPGKVTAVGVGTTVCTVSSGVTSCWGRNTYGDVGDGTTTPRTTPVQVVGLPGVGSAISPGDDATCALTRAGAVFCWGDDLVGELGDGRSGTGAMSTVPVAVQGL